MSKTDKTKPWRVRVAEHNPRPEHDHTDGVCDLPDDRRVWVAWDGSPRCRWSDDGLARRASCCGGCGCQKAYCGSAYWKVEARRSERRAGRRESRRELQAFISG